MPTAWWQRLRPAQRAEYEQSVRLTRAPLRQLPDPAAARDALDALARALARDERPRVEQVCADIARLLCGAAAAPPVAVRVAGTRPSEARGELHGLYELPSGTAPPRITVWMRTAQRRDVVKPRTFLRVLLHEIVHHLDVTVLELPSSFHTPGFFQRESHLMRALTSRDSPPPRQRTSAGESDPPGPTPEEGIAAVRSVLARLRARESGESDDGTRPRGPRNR